MTGTLEATVITTTTSIRDSELASDGQALWVTTWKIKSVYFVLHIYKKKDYVVDMHEAFATKKVGDSRYAQAGILVIFTPL